MHITRRQLSFADYQVPFQVGEPGAAPYLLAGRRMYAIGIAANEMVPIGLEHIVGELGGLWAHPVKVAEGVVVSLHERNGDPLPVDEASFEDQLAAICWTWRSGQTTVRREDVIAADDLVYYSHVTVAAGAEGFAGTLRFTAHLKFLGAWFSGMQAGGGNYWQNRNMVLGSDLKMENWGVACGLTRHVDGATLAAHGHGATASFDVHLTLAAGDTTDVTFVLAAEHEGGSVGAADRWDRASCTFQTQRAYQQQRFVGRHATLELEAPGDLGRDLALAHANICMLEAEYPQTGPFFLAGLPEYPQLFGCDTCYTVVGAVAAGFDVTMRDSLIKLASYAARACGRIPHEVTTSGRVFNPGNVQETPQFAIACWDYLRWTGDLATIRQLFPVCREGMLELIPALSMPGGYYPIGDGMVERLGMGSRKLDSACYNVAGLLALAEMAEALHDPIAAACKERAQHLHAAFEQDWWMEHEGLYADSMHSDGPLQLDGHWTVVLPAQLGIAPPERTQRILDSIERDYVNEWGLVHTRGDDPRVWTLPTGLLALALFRNGRADAGLRMLLNIGDTIHYGTPGALKELIPEGLCFVQLWSAGLLIQAVLEGLWGLAPLAHKHQLAVAPRLPHGWERLRLNGVRVGPHRLNLALDHGRLTVEHQDGAPPLEVRYQAQVGADWITAHVPAGTTVML
ncbi:MAG: amylo-alpha-1,6-glucosidase [Chloroflexaceae bacterium]|jgi:hypothetical protein|nr:amylo-alpha-1,6-glucosidase [Chloroflexaceae bacterium]